MTPAQRATVCLLLTTVIWGWSYAEIRATVTVHGVLPFLALRFALASVVMAPVAWRGWAWSNAGVGVRIGLVLACAYGTQAWGLCYTTASNSGLISGLFVLFAIGLNRLMYGVPMRRHFWPAALLSMVGTALLTGASAAPLNRGDGLALLSAFFWGLHVVLLDRHARRHAACALAWVQVLTSTLVFAMAWPLEQPVTLPAAAPFWVAVAATGILATALGFFAQTYAQQHISAWRTSIILTLEPVFALAFGVLLAGERLSWPQGLGALLLLAAVVLVEVVPRRPPPPAAPAA